MSLSYQFDRIEGATGMHEINNCYSSIATMFKTGAYLRKGAIVPCPPLDFAFQ